MTIEIGDNTSLVQGTVHSIVGNDPFIADHGGFPSDAWFKISAANLATIPATKRLYLTNAGFAFANANGTGSYVMKSYDGLTTYKTETFNGVAWGNDGNSYIAGIIEITDEMKARGLYVIPTNMCIQSVTVFNETVPPEFTSTPNVRDVTASAATLDVVCDEVATAYYSVSRTSDNLVPSSAYVKAGATGSMVLAKDITSSTVVSGLLPETAYDVFVTAEDAAGNLQASPTLIQFKTLDGNPPILTEVAVDRITETSVYVGVTSTESGNAYCSVVARNTPAPTSEEVRDAVNGSVIFLDANQIGERYIEDLQPATEYDLYVVADDQSGNLQLFPTKLQFKTLGRVSITPTAFSLVDIEDDAFAKKLVGKLSTNVAYDSATFYHTAISPQNSVVTEDDFINSTIRKLYSDYAFGADIESYIGACVENDNKLGRWQDLEVGKDYTVYYRVVYKDAVGSFIQTDFGSINFSIPGPKKEDLMEQIYFGDADIKVKISTEKSYMGGNLNKVILVTGEAAIPLAVFAGNGGYAALQAHLVSLGKTAPELLKATQLLLTQIDNNGNEIIPEYFYVLGVPSSSADMVAQLLAAADACDYYGIVPTDHGTEFLKALVTEVLVPKHRIAIVSYPLKTLEANYAVSDRVICIHDENMEHKNAAWAGRVLQYEKFIGWKWKNLAGCSVEALTPTEQQAAIASKLNIYKYIRGRASTSGSLATAAEEAHIDSTIAKDIIVMNVATSLLDMFTSNEILTLGFHGKVEVEKAIRTALIYCGSLGLIESNEDNTYQYTVTVPDITAEMRQSRKLKGVKFSYVLATNMETIEVDGLELLALVGGDS